MRDGILLRRGKTPKAVRSLPRPFSSDDLKKAKLKKTPQKPNQTAASSMEQAFERMTARRPSIAGKESKDEDEDAEEWEMEGSGLPSGADKMINQLYVALGPIRAGNTSVKLRKKTVSLLSKMTKAGVLNELQRRKILTDYHILD